MLDTETKLDVGQFLASLAQSTQSALLLDYDGTLAPFRANRDHARPYSGVPALLEEIMRTGRTRVVLISGRRAEEIVPLLGVVPQPEIWGVHGLQRLRPDGSCEIPPLDPLVEKGLEDAVNWLKQLEVGEQAEVKPGSVAVHWRGLEESVAERIRGTVQLGWLPIADRAHLTLQRFDGGVEIQAPGCNKGDAVRKILAEMDAETPVAYLGDDQTDEDAFHALQHRGLGVLVNRKRRETAADIWIRPPAQLIEFLLGWLDATTTR